MHLQIRSSIPTNHFSSPWYFHSQRSYSISNGPSPAFKAPSQTSRAYPHIRKPPHTLCITCIFKFSTLSGPSPRSLSVSPAKDLCILSPNSEICHLSGLYTFRRGSRLRLAANCLISSLLPKNLMISGRSAARLPRMITRSDSTQVKRTRTMAVSIVCVSSRFG